MCEEKVNQIIDTLRTASNKDSYIDVSDGMEHIFKCTKEELNLAVKTLVQEGYELQRLKIHALFNSSGTTGTTIKIKLLGKKQKTNKERCVEARKLLTRIHNRLLAEDDPTLRDIFELQKNLCLRIGRLENRD